MGTSINIQGFNLFTPSTWVPTFGNHCGPGWSGGMRTDVAQPGVPAIKIESLQRSPVDELCRIHDLAYMQAEDKPNQASLIMTADKELRQGIAALSFSTLSFTEKIYAGLMDMAFATKIHTVNTWSVLRENNTFATGSRADGNAWNTIGGGTSGFGGSTVQPGSMTNTAPNQGPGYPTPTVTQSSGGSGGGGGGGGNSGFGGSKVQPGSATNTAPNQGPGWAPIVIDLDGDGVEIKPLSRSSTTFDADSDGYKERSAWAGADDGLLVIDLNGDGQVTQSKEIAFSEWTAEQDTDLQALVKVFDSNGDGTFDSRDSRFNEFRIGKDANSNGVADAGEMMMLQEAGIAANDANYRRCA